MSGELCTCGGYNQDCFRCDGTGLVRRARGSQTRLQDTGGRLLGGSGSRRRVGAKARRGPDWTSCPECKCKLKKKNRRAHLRKVHEIDLPAARLPEEAARSKPTRNGDTADPDRDNGSSIEARRSASGSTEKPAPEWTSCPYCNIKLKHLRKHVRRQHPEHADTAVKRPSAKRRKSKGPKLVKCEICGAVRVRSLMKAHMKSAHSSGRNRSARKPNRNSKGSRRPTTTTRGGPSHPDAIEREMDATRHLGHVRREGGRFGSHPAHDDYGDEGMP